MIEHTIISGFTVSGFTVIKFLEVSSVIVILPSPGIGRDLHAALLAREETLDPQHSYIHHAWLDMYLCDRRSVLLNSNTFLTYSDHPDPALNTQINRATQLVTSTLRYFCMLRDNKLPPINTCMMQFPLLFQSTRIPGKTRDENVRFPDSRHLAVLHKGHVYSIDVLDSRGEIRDTAALQLALEEILADSRAPNKQGLGYFTALEREEWSNVRAKLEVQNKPFLDVIDEAIREQFYMHSIAAQRGKFAITEIELVAGCPSESKITIGLRDKLEPSNYIF